MKIGFMGLGHMGSKMAERLLLAGHDLHVYNRTSSRANSLMEKGAKLVECPADLCDSQIVISMLSDDKALESVVYGEQGLLKYLEPGCIHISMSTISPNLAEHLEADHMMMNAYFVGAPVFGRPEAAATGDLVILAGCESQLLKHCQSVFSVLGQKVLHVSESPAHAHLAKVLGNFMLISSIEMLSESLALAQKSGLDQKNFLEAMTNSLFSAPLYKNYGGMIVDRTYDKKGGFSMPLALKDIRLAQQAASEAHSPLPMASLVHDHIMTAIARGLRDMDLSALGKLASDNAGVLVEE